MNARRKENEMITRLILAQPKPGTHPEILLTALQRLNQLRQEWGGIVDLTIGVTTSSEYPYGAVLRFVQPYISIPVVNSPEYQEVVKELEQHATILTLNIQHEEHKQINPTSSPAYGFFTPTVEERLRTLVYLWFQGAGQSLCRETVMAQLPLPDDFGLSLVEFDKALEQQFGVKGVSDILIDEKATFGDLLSALETELAEVKSSSPSQERKDSEAKGN
jgi:hypothetical protein